MRTPDGVELSYRYNAAHYLIEVHDSQGNALTFDYDRSGARTAERLHGPDGQALKQRFYRYDPRVSGVADPYEFGG